MKKMTALVLATGMCLGLAVPALAVTTEKIDDVTITNVVRKETKTFKIHEYDWESNTDYIAEKAITVYYVEDGATITTTDFLSGTGSYILEGDVYEPYEGGQLGESWTVDKAYDGGLLHEIITGSTDQQIYYMLDDGDTPAFTDVAADSPYAAPIDWAVARGITKGTSDTTFSPDVTCTTAQILTFLWRAYGSPAATIENPFTDLPDNDYAGAALWAVEKGLVTADSYDADAPCTRGTTVTYLWKLDGESKLAEEVSFVDVAPDAAYADAVSWAVDRGITNGTSETTFSPDEPCTRAQIMTFLYRYFI